LRSSRRRLDGLKFRRQTSIGPFIVDFVCFDARLIVEADGPHHEAEADRARDAELARRGFRVLRFANRRIIEYPDLEHDAFARER